MLVILLPASESSCLWFALQVGFQSECSVWPVPGGIYPTPPPPLLASSWSQCVDGARRTEWDSTKTGGGRGGVSVRGRRVCVRARAWKCESDCVRGGRREERRREGFVQGDRDKRLWTQNYADINAEPKVPERGACMRGTDKSLSSPDECANTADKRSVMTTCWCTVINHIILSYVNEQPEQRAGLDAVIRGHPLIHWGHEGPSLVQFLFYFFY